MVRTRFAPSPTGYLHIGGVRTALFNWLFARRHGGQFLLRIDDTDQQRNVESALAPILHGFRWLGIDWDEGPEVGGPYAPYYQSQRLARYQAEVQRLLESGHAYRDFATTDELQAEREAAQAEKRPFLYSRRWMAETPADVARFEAQGRAGVVRLKIPREGTLALDDLVRGRVEFDWAREQDHVVQRADGTCLYHLASVVDDYDFRITHVIRAEEHLSNTPRQVFIAQSLGYPLPAYAHLPYVAEPGSKNKLSKRKLDKYLKNRDFAQVNEHGLAIARALGLQTTPADASTARPPETPADGLSGRPPEITPDTFNPVIVDFYEQVGYLPDAIVNYLMLLGWSLDDKTEFLTRQQMIDNFSLDRVTKAPASFDPKKLWSFQDHYMRELPLDQKVEAMLPLLVRAGLIPAAADTTQPEHAAARAKLARIVAASGDRLKVTGDILAYSDFFFRDEIPYDPVAVGKRFRAPGAAQLLADLHALLKNVEPFDVPALEAAIHAFIERSGKPSGDVVHTLRLAVTGKTVGPGLYDCLSILGRDASLKRLAHAATLSP